MPSAMILGLGLILLSASEAPLKILRRTATVRGMDAPLSVSHCVASCFIYFSLNLGSPTVGGAQREGSLSVLEFALWVALMVKRPRGFASE